MIRFGKEGDKLSPPVLNTSLEKFEALKSEKCTKTQK